MKITYTGSLRFPLVLSEGLSNLIIPKGAAVGQQTISALPGLTVLGLAYSEANATAGERVTALSFDDLAGVSVDLSLTQNAVLADLDFAELLAVGGLVTVNQCATLASVNFNKLIAVGGALTFQNLAALLVASLPDLESVGGQITVGGNAVLSTLSFAQLKYAGGINIGGTCPALNSISLPSLLKTNGAITLSGGSLPLASLPALTHCGAGFTVNNSTVLTTVSLPALVEVGGNIAANSGNGAITSFTLGTVGVTKLLGGATINLSGQALPAAEVNGILALLVSLDGTNGTTLWGTGKTLTINGGTNAAPTGQGATDKATLQARGATITTN